MTNPRGSSQFSLKDVSNLILKEKRFKKRVFERVEKMWIHTGYQFRYDVYHQKL